MPASRNTAAVRGIAYHLPEGVLTNEELADQDPKWSADQISDKTGIVQRRIAGVGECASDLAVTAAQELFTTGVCEPSDVDYLLLCTQSPDYFLPTTACLLQERLGLPTSAGAMDFNLGCSGYVYGLGLAKGLIETRQASKVLLLTAETYSKFIAPESTNVRTLFGDAAAATLVVADESNNDEDSIGPFVYGTDGRGKDNLIVADGGMRSRGQNGGSDALRLYMNGPEIFSFTLKAVPTAVHALLDRAELSQEDVDLFVFHQANQFMLEQLRTKIGIPEEKFVVAMSHCGNTVSSTIPIALRDASTSGQLRPGQRVMLVGFGVGYSWGATLLRWAA